MENFISVRRLSYFFGKLKTYVTNAISTAIAELKSGLKLSDIKDVSVKADEVNHLDGVTGNVQTQLNAKAPLASPALTGTPTAPTATSGTNTDQIATTKFVKEAVDGVIADLGSALTYKGSKDTYEALPAAAQNSVGDTWNVVAAHGNTPAGTNYAWNGESWDPLGGDIDLSGYATNESLKNYYDKTTADGKFATQEELNGYLQDGDLVEASEEDIDEMFS